MKKIAIGLNLFGTSPRTDMCIESLIRAKNKYPDNIDLYNVQFVDESIKHRLHPSFKLIRVLKETNHDYITRPSKRTIPMLKEIFDELANLNYEYFCFVNDDIIVSDRYFKFILETDYDTYPASRLAIEPIKTLNDEIIGSHFQVSGFDAFCIRTEWWLKNRDRFPTYILGTPPWDIHYATLCMKDSNGKSTICNKWPPPLFHLIHGDDAHLPSPELDYNNGVFWKPYKFDSDMWHNYLFKILLRRPGANYQQHHDNELELEKVFFNTEWFKKNYWSYQ